MSKELLPSVPPAPANSKKQITRPWCLFLEPFKIASFTVLARQTHWGAGYGPSLFLSSGGQGQG